MHLHMTVIHVQMDELVEEKECFYSEHVGLQA